jgi:hypothetical protein
MLRDQTAIITGTWPRKYENWRGKFVFPSHAESCLTLPYGTSEGQIV